MSEIRTNAYLEPLPQFLHNGPLVMITSWKAPADNHDALVRHVRDNMDLQRLTPGNLFYSRTRHWYRPIDDSLEQWWFMDEYDSPEAFAMMQEHFRSLMAGQGSDAAQKIWDAWLELIVPGSIVDQTLYSEVIEGRINFEPFADRQRAMQVSPGEQSPVN